jgi:lipopolysaccharide exporter
VCTANTWPVFIALGRPWINAALTGLGAILLVPLLLWSVQTAGALGAAWALVAVSAVLLAANLFAALRLLQLPARQLLGQTWRTALAVATTSGAIFVVQAQWSETERIFDIVLLLVGSILIGAATYLASLWLLWRLTGTKDGPEQTALRILQISISSMSARFNPSHS